MKSLLKKKSYGLPERFTSIGNDKCGVPGWGKYLWLTQIFLAGKEKRERCRRTQGWVILERNLEYLRIFIVVKIQVDPPPPGIFKRRIERRTPRPRHVSQEERCPWKVSQGHWGSGLTAMQRFHFSLKATGMAETGRRDQICAFQESLWLCCKRGWEGARMKMRKSKLTNAGDMMKNAKASDHS